MEGCKFTFLASIIFSPSPCAQSWRRYITFSETVKIQNSVEMQGDVFAYSLGHMSPVICTLQAPTLRAGLMTVASHMYTGTQAHKYTGTQYTVPRYTGGGKYFHSSLHPGHSLSSAKTNHKMSVFYSFFLTSRFWPRLDAPLAGAGVVAASTQSCKNRSTSMSMSMSMSPSTSMSISRSMRLFSR